MTKITLLKQTQIAEAAEYLPVFAPEIKELNENSARRLREDIILQAQGEAVELSESGNLAELMIVFDAIHQVSPEAVLKAKSGERFLLFSHWFKPVLRDKDIITDFGGKMIEKSEITSKPAENLMIDIGKICEATNDVKAVKKCVQKIKKEIMPAETATLMGKGPALAFLIVQHMLYGVAGEIWYQKDENSGAIQIR